ncbi:hypothetical protein FE783_34165 [Paenibacillus mesophilus]|uniref:hypothetical protein n=1 Tax=Paenibacillus mesophilus TaxID=2582849 RepID=UPI00110E280C|nr:hypothetical protein [Paenibacillus mesophilus]TMV43815.1 hypothetical protein FE783_34165 [Paenibacillus mesophilus]
MAIECGRDDALPYDHVGRGILEDLFVLALDAPIAIGAREGLTGALQMILAHYRGEEVCGPRIVYGLNAYDTWIEAFRGAQIEPNGNAYNVAVVQDARHYASAFLAELADTWQGDSVADERIRSLSREASGLYRNMAEELLVLRDMFPFPTEGEPNQPAQAERSIGVLQSVKRLEQQAVGLLETKYETLQADSAAG